MRQDHIDIVKNFFSLIEQRDIDGLVDLFDENCIVYEPFSKENGLQK
jgi:ketosteroid isomerase-like protein